MFSAIRWNFSPESFHIPSFSTPRSPASPDISFCTAAGDQFGRWVCGLVLSRSVVSDSVVPWTVARQAPLSMGFSRQEHGSGLPFPSPRDLPDPRMEPRSPTLQADSLPSEPAGKPLKGPRQAAILSEFPLSLHRGHYNYRSRYEDWLG